MLRMVEIPLRGSKSTLRVGEMRALPANDEARNPFGLRASFTLAAIYSRGTCRPTTIDVLMFHFRVRNGTGWGHQAMTTRLQEGCLSACPIIIFAALFYGILAGRLTSAWHVFLC